MAKCIIGSAGTSSALEIIKALGLRSVVMLEDKRNYLRDANRRSSIPFDDAK